MEISRPLLNLLKQAKAISIAGTVDYYKLTASVITPTQHIPLYFPTAFSCDAMFATARSDDFRLLVQVQPGVYLKDVVPYCDDLKIELIFRQGIKQTSRLYRAIPLIGSDPEKEGNNTQLSNLKNMDNLNMVGVTFQLQELGFAALRVEMVGDVALMGTLDTVLMSELIEKGQELTLTGPDAFRGVDMVTPIDNPKVFKHIEMKDGLRLMDLPGYLQNDTKYGMYSKGLGCYYRKGMFYVYPLFKMGRYDTAKRVLDIYRLPEDAVPAVETTYYINGTHTIILSTGQANHDSRSDITKQNKGVGKRIINPDAVISKAGNYYEKGAAVTTRTDTLTEYKTSQRTSGEEISVFEAEPTSNIWKGLSSNALYDGEILRIPWDSSNSTLIVPGMPCKYYYTTNNENLVEREGVVIGARSRLMMNTPGDPQPVFREMTDLLVFFIFENEVTSTAA